MKFSTLPVCMAVIVLAACSHTIPESATKPQAPPQLGKTPPVIQPLSAGQKQAQAPESLLPVTMTAALPLDDDMPDVASRRDRLLAVKRKVEDAIRPRPKAEPVPESPAPPRRTGAGPDASDSRVGVPA